MTTSATPSWTHRLAPPLGAMALLAALAWPAPALAQIGGTTTTTPVPLDSPWTPASTPPDQAFRFNPQLAIQAYLKSMPGLPANLLVVPATGSVPWSGIALSENIPAEVWSVVQDNPRNKPLLMFAVNLLTGEVVAMHLRPIPNVPNPAPAPPQR